MTDRKVSVVNVSPRHPRGGAPSIIQMAFDTGLKSGKLTIEEVSIDEALDLAEALISAVNIVRGVNADKGAV